MRDWSGTSYATLTPSSETVPIRVHSRQALSGTILIASSGLALVRIISVASRIKASTCAASNAAKPGRNSKDVATQRMMRRSPSRTSHSCHDCNVVRSLSALESRLALTGTSSVLSDPGQLRAPSPLPKRSRGAPPLSCNHTVYQVRLELARHTGRAIHAVADKTDASARQMLDR